MYSAQSRKSAKFFLQSSVLGLPHPLTRRRVCPPPPLWFRGGQTLWYSRYIVLCGFQHKYSHCGQAAHYKKRRKLNDNKKLTSTDSDMRYAK